ncbi:hypothetical protein [Treponema sp. R6D11]
MRKRRNPVIWALFDSETGSVRNALPEFTVYSFGLGDGTGHIELDLSNFKKAKKILDRYPKPDIIFASPPCTSWVLISGGSLWRFVPKGEVGFNLYWKNKWTPYHIKPEFDKIRELGIATAMCTAQIIQHYRPKHWSIENGNTSYIFQYLMDFANMKGYLNRTKYACYGWTAYKPTIIFSDVHLQLRDHNPRKPFTNFTIKEQEKIYDPPKDKRGGISLLRTYAERSHVPHNLIRHILSQFLNEPLELGDHGYDEGKRVAVPKKTAVTRKYLG